MKDDSVKGSRVKERDDGPPVSALMTMMMAE